MIRTARRQASEPVVGGHFAGYVLDELVGDSSVGAVYRAHEEGLGRTVALRIVGPGGRSDPATRERLNRESTVLASLDHPNVAPIYAASEAEGQLYIATRWIDGATIPELVAQEGPLDPRRVVRIVIQVAAAVEAAHEKGIMHRNVKPSSVLVTSTDHAYLTDFGLARRSEDLTGLTMQESLLASFDYVAPEYIEGGEVDRRVDIYGLGCVLYEALTGEVPFPGTSPAAKMYAHLSADPPSARAVRPDIPEPLDKVIRKAMAKDPDARPQSASEFAAEAAAAVDMSAPLWAARASDLAPSEMEPPHFEPSPVELSPVDPPPVEPSLVEPRSSDVEPGPAPSDFDPLAQPPQPEPVAADGFEQPHYYRARPRWRLGVGAVWAVCFLLFVAAPIALLVALLHG